MGESRQSPRISANKLAEYLTASAGRRKTILTDQKHPSDFKTARYKEATQAISRFIAGGCLDTSVLSDTEEYLRGRNPQSAFQAQDRDLSLDALQSVRDVYSQWGLIGSNLSLGAANASPLFIAGVKISVRPEIISRSVNRKGEKTVGAMKLHLPKSSSPSKKNAEYVCTLLHWFCEEHLVDEGIVDYQLCKLIDVPAGVLFEAPKAYKKRRADIEAACEEIAARWASL